MSKKFCLEIAGNDGKPLFLQSLKLKKGSVYASELSLTSDKRIAATFENMTALLDASDALDLLMAKKVIMRSAPRNSRGVLYQEFA